MNAQPQNTTTHVFESAGLGKAPFRFITVIERRGPVKLPDGSAVGREGQPMGVCALCGTGMAYCYVVESHDHKQFEVGCECVSKTGDKGLIDIVKKQARKVALKKRHVQEAVRIATAKENYTDAVKRALRIKPHPYTAYEGDFFSSKTLADFVDYMFQCGGNAGKIKACKVIEAELERH